MAVKYPIGVDDYARLRQENYFHVDKSLLIKDLIDSGTVITLFTRPRRFGKTLNMSMLYHFFRNDVDSVSLFKDTKLWQAGSPYQAEINQYPTLFISLKEIKAASFEESYDKFSTLMQNLYIHFNFLMSSDSLADEFKKRFQTIANKQASLADISNALGDLCRYLAKHFGQPVYLLIDEYDAPLHEAFDKGYYQDMIDLMRGVFGWALKGNPALKQGVMTGILRIAKESIFSDLNNLDVCTVLNDRYAQHFGFLEQEVEGLLQQINTSPPDSMAKMRDWYNGYRFGSDGTFVYNPWSILKCLQESFKLQAYWVNTSSNRLVGDVLLNAEAEVKADLERLLMGKTIDITFDENIVFKDLSFNPKAVWGLLVASGYLTVTKSVQPEDIWYHQVCIPNKELFVVFDDSIKRWLSEARLPTDSRLFHYLVSGDIESFTELLSQFLLHTISYFDVAFRPAEQVYHAFVLGLLLSAQQNQYIVKSNRESGLGRYDVMLIPQDKSQRGFVLEFKCAKHAEATTEELSQLTDVALQQIKDKQYATELRQLGIQDILALALVFSNKEVVAKQEIL